MQSSDRAAGWTSDPAVLTRVAQAILPGAHLIGWQMLSGGISAATVALTVAESAAGDAPLHQWVVREPSLARQRGNLDAAAREFRTLEALAAAEVAAPRPVALDEQETLIPFPYLVMTRVPGQMLLAPAQPHIYAVQMAEQLARIHGVAANDVGPDVLESVTDALDWMAADPTIASLDRGLNEAEVQRWLQTMRPDMVRNTPVLLHGDFWPGNLLWKWDGEDGLGLTGVVDWEDSMTGDPLADVAVARLDVLWLYGRHWMEVFTEAYRSRMAHLDYTYLPAWDFFAVMRTLSWIDEQIVDWAAHGRPEMGPVRRRAGLRQFVEWASANAHRAGLLW